MEARSQAGLLLLYFDYAMLGRAAIGVEGWFSKEGKGTAEYSVLSGNPVFSYQLPSLGASVALDACGRYGVCAQLSCAGSRSTLLPQL